MTSVTVDTGFLTSLGEPVSNVSCKFSLPSCSHSSVVAVSLAQVHSPPCSKIVTHLKKRTNSQAECYARQKCSVVVCFSEEQPELIIFILPPFRQLWNYGTCLWASVGFGCCWQQLHDVGEVNRESGLLHVTSQDCEAVGKWSGNSTSALQRLTGCWAAENKTAVSSLTHCSGSDSSQVPVASQHTSISIRMNYFANPGFGRKKLTHLDKSWFSLFARVDLLAFCRFNQELIWTSGPAVHQLHTKSLLVLSALLAKLKWSISPIHALCWTYLTPTSHGIGVPQAFSHSSMINIHCVPLLLPSYTEQHLPKGDFSSQSKLSNLFDS